jgi:DNA-binding transcriptional regulator YiaG
MTDADLVRQAEAASGLGRRGFAALLRVDESTVGRWKDGARTPDGPALVICRAIIRDPAIVASLAPS